MWRPRYSQSFVSTKGLRNAPGENNCFLNSAIQVLWHLDVFRRSFRLLSGHVCMDNSCIFCALKVLFTQFQYSDQTSLPPDSMRKALAQTFADQQRFQMGFMDDAAECLENILMRIHSHIAHTESEDMCNAPHCIPHRKFAMRVVEQIVCRCGATSEPLPFTQMVHYVSTRTLVEEWRYMIDNSREYQTDIFDQLLRTTNARSDLRDCPSNCGCRVEIRRNLMNKPDVVCVGLVWDSDRPAPSHIMDVLRCIGTSLRLSNVFHNAVDGVRAKPLSLVGVVCYYGKHYSTFFYNTRLNSWIYFDDAVVQEMGTDWNCVVDKCCRGHYQPLLLLYANHEADVINADSAPQFITRIANQTLPMKHTAPGAAVQPSAFHSVQRITGSSGQMCNTVGNPQRRAVTPGPIRSDRDPADDYDVEARRAVTPGPDKTAAAFGDDYDITSSGQYHSDEQLADKRAAAVHVRQSSYLQAVDFPPPAHPGGAPNYHHVHETVKFTHPCKDVPDEGYYTQRSDHRQGDGRLSSDYRTNLYGREYEQSNVHNGLDALDGSSDMQSNQVLYTDYMSRQTECSREKTVKTEQMISQTDNGSAGQARTTQDNKSLPPHKSRLAKAAEIQRKESFKRGSKIPTDVIRFDVSDVPTNPVPKMSRKPNHKVAHSTSANRGGLVDIGQKGAEWQYSKYKMAECKPLQTSHLPRSQSNYALDNPSSRKHRRERRHTLHSNPDLADKYDLQKNSSSTVNCHKLNPAETGSGTEADHQESSRHRYSGPPPYEHIPQTVNTKPSVIQSDYPKNHTNNREQKESSPALPPAYDQTGRTLDSYLSSSTTRTECANHTKQPSTDSTHNADRNRKASENLYQHYQMRGLHVSKTPGSSNCTTAPKDHLLYPASLYKRETSVTDSDYNSGDRNSSSSNNSLPPLETKESRLAMKLAADRKRMPPSYEQTCLAGISKSSVHNFDKHGHPSSMTNIQNSDTTALPPGMESDVRDLCCKAENLMAESLLKEEQTDLTLAMHLCTQAITYLKQAIQLETCSYESHVYARMKHNTCVLRSRSLHRRIMMRQDSNTNGSEASDNVSESSLQTDDSGLPLDFDIPIPGMKHSISVPGIYEENCYRVDAETHGQNNEKQVDEPPYVSNLIRSWNSKLSAPEDHKASTKPSVKPYAHVYIPAKGNEMRGSELSSAKTVHQTQYPGEENSSVVPDSHCIGSKYGDFSIEFVNYSGHPVSNDGVASGQYRHATSDKLGGPPSYGPSDVYGQYAHSHSAEEKTVSGKSVGQKAAVCVTSSKEQSFSSSADVADSDKRSLEIFGTLPRKRGGHGKQNSVDNQKLHHCHQDSSSSSTPQHTRENSLDNSLDPKQSRDAGSSYPQHRRDMSCDGMLQTSNDYSSAYIQSGLSNHLQSATKDIMAVAGRLSDHRREFSKDSSLDERSNKHSRESSSDSTLQGSHHSRQSSSSSHTSHTAAPSSGKLPSHTGQQNSQTTVYHQFPSSVKTNADILPLPQQSSSVPACPPSYAEINSSRQQYQQHAENQNSELSHNQKRHNVQSEQNDQSWSRGPGDQQGDHRQVKSYSCLRAAASHSNTVHADRIPYSSFPPPPPQAAAVHEQSSQLTCTSTPHSSTVELPAPHQQHHDAYRTSSSSHVVVPQNYQSKAVPSVSVPSLRQTAPPIRGPKPVPPMRVSSIPNTDQSKPAVSQQQNDPCQSQPQLSVKALKQQLEQQHIGQFSGQHVAHGNTRQVTTSGVGTSAQHGTTAAYTTVQKSRQLFDQGYNNKLQQGADLSANNSNTFRTEGHGKYQVTGSGDNSSSNGNKQVTAAMAVYLGPPQPADALDLATASNNKNLPCLKKGRRSAGNLPTNVKPLTKSVKFSEQVVLVGTMDDVPQEQDYFSLVENLLNRRGKPPPKNSPMPARKHQPGQAGKILYDTDVEDNNSDTGSSTSDSAESDDKVRCNLCRKKHIDVREMYCEACRHYLARLGQASAT